MLAALQPGTLFHGRYRVVSCINKGGMGAVYEVADETTAAARALKVMLPSIVEDAGLRDRFAREATVTGGVESDHLVRVLDAGVDAATAMPFLVMDLLRGEDLHVVLKRRGGLPPGEVVTYLQQTAAGLDKTHAAGVVHRDLKPANLLLTRRDDGSACVKILDFGVAKLVAQSRDAGQTMPLGTPLYMAPEQVRGDGTIGPPADIYALGLIAYTLLVGEPYWNEERLASESLFPLLTKIAVGALEPASARALRRRAITLPAGFDAWFRVAVAIAPEARFDRASTAITALAAIVAGTSPPESTTRAVTHDSLRPAAIRSVWPRALGALVIVLAGAVVAASLVHGRATPSPAGEAPTVAASAPAAPITSSPTAPPAPSATSSAPAITPSLTSKARHPPPAATASARPPEARTIF
ncbi:MAG: protein kinase [Byssovorax sp.]